MMFLSNSKRESKDLDFVFVMNGIYIKGSGGTRILNALVSELENLGYKVGVLILDRKPWLDFLERDKKISRNKISLMMLRLNDTRLGYYVLNPIFKKIVKSPDDGKLRADKLIFSKKQFLHFSVKFLIATNFINGAEVINMRTKTTKILFSQIDESDQIYAGSYTRIAMEVYSKFRNRLFLNHEMLRKFPGSRITTVGINHSVFNIKIDIGDRKPTKVVFILRPGEQKDPYTAIAAMRLLHAQDENIELSAFGTLQPNLVPSFIRYHYRPTNTEISELLNQNSIFVMTSTVEGTPAPPLEAMACGCAVVSTDCAGIGEYLEDGFNGLLAPIKQQNVIAEKVSLLIFDSKLRLFIAKNGIETSHKYTYKKMTLNFIDAIRNFEKDEVPNDT